MFTTKRNLGRIGLGALALTFVLALRGDTLQEGAANTPRVEWDERAEVARGEAHRGPWRQNESEFHFVDDPTAAIDGEGRVGVVWANQAALDIFFQLFEPDGTPRFEEPVNVSRSPDIFSWLPRVRFSPGDPARIDVLWQEIVFSGGSHGGEIFFARSLDGGRTFSEPLNLSNSPAGAGKGRLDAQSWHNGSLDLAVGPQGELYAAWTEYEGALWLSRSTDAGATFSEPLHIAGDDDVPARGPALAVGPRGFVHVAWTVGEDPAADIRLARSTDAGQTFTEPHVVAGEGHADSPKLAVDRAGILHLVYAESAEGRGGGYRLHYANSPEGEYDFAPPREIAARPDEEIDSVHFPALHLDGSDNLYVLWELFPDRRRRPQGLGLTYSTDGGRHFAPPTVVPGSADPEFGRNGGLQGLLMNKLAVNRQGTLAVVNSTFQPDETSRIWLFRGRLRE